MIYLPSISIIRQKGEENLLESEVIILVEIILDEKHIEERFMEEVKKRLDQLERQQVFWDMKTLCKVTCMSENFIKEQFFYDPRFPKFRVGKKWLMPAKETEEFLLKWLKEQPRN